MKKFRIIRNVLIVVVILIAVIYITWIRSSKTESSITAKLYKNMFEDSYKNEKNITLDINYDNEKTKIGIIYATDNMEEKEISCFIHDNYDDTKTGSENLITYSVTTKNDVKNYSVFPKSKKYEVITEDIEGNDSYDTWISNTLAEILSCNYYTKGYEFINGKLLYYENFKSAGLKMYFYKNELVFMKSTEFDNAFDDMKNVLYSVKITYDDAYKRYTEIPQDYTGYTVKYNTETNETERIEIK